MHTFLTKTIQCEHERHEYAIRLSRGYITAEKKKVDNWPVCNRWLKYNINFVLCERLSFRTMRFYDNWARKRFSISFLFSLCVLLLKMCLFKELFFKDIYFLCYTIKIFLTRQSAVEGSGSEYQMTNKKQDAHFIYTSSFFYLRYIFIIYISLTLIQCSFL